MKSKYYSARRQPTDCWNASLIYNAELSNYAELPMFKTSVSLPSDVISFKNINSLENRDKWIHFYEHDDRLEAVWESPTLYLNSFIEYAGIISPDFSVCQDMPILQQGYNVYRSRSLAFWFSSKGIPVIPNIQWADERSYKFCFDGIEPNSTVSISTCGTLQYKEDRLVFQRGLPEMMNALTPKNIIVYGQMPADVFSEYKNCGVNFVQFDSDTQKAHGGGGANG